MRRREFIVILTWGAIWTAPATAQSPVPDRPVVGVLSPQSPLAAARNMQALRDGLRDLGYVEGRNIAIDARFADGAIERLPALAAQLVAQRPPVIVAGSMPAIMAVRNASQTIPIVMSAILQDPVAAGLAAGIARSGGNVTGFWSEGDGGLLGKRLELLKDAIPGTFRIGVLVHPADHAEELSVLPEASHSLGLQFTVIEVHSPADFQTAFAVARGQGVQALYVSQTPFLFSHRVEVTAMAVRARLPSVSG